MKLLFSIILLKIFIGLAKSIETCSATITYARTLRNISGNINAISDLKAGKVVWYSGNCNADGAPPAREYCGQYPNLKHYCKDGINSDYSGFTYLTLGEHATINEIDQKIIHINCLCACQLKSNKPLYDYNLRK
jgi:hypothetical protein